MVAAWVPRWGFEPRRKVTQDWAAGPRDAVRTDVPEVRAQMGCPLSLSLPLRNPPPPAPAASPSSFLEMISTWKDAGAEDRVRPARTSDLPRAVAEGLCCFRAKFVIIHCAAKKTNPIARIGWEGPARPPSSSFCILAAAHALSGGRDAHPTARSPASHRPPSSLCSISWFSFFSIPLAAILALRPPPPGYGPSRGF